MKKKEHQEKESERGYWLNALSLLSQLGLTMGACVFLGVLAGKYLDRWLGTSPWLLLVCALVGAAASFKVLYDTVIKEWDKK